MRGGRDRADRGNATVAERHDTEREHECALARPHRSERDLSTEERSAVRHLAERARPSPEPRRDTSAHGATNAKAPPPWHEKSPIQHLPDHLGNQQSAQHVLDLCKQVRSARGSSRQAATAAPASWRGARRFHLCDRPPKARRTCSSMEASSSCVASEPVADRRRTDGQDQRLLERVDRVDNSGRRLHPSRVPHQR
jgi:hypothetical protein